MGPWNLHSAVVPVTGAASGIGLAVCRRLRAEGATPLLLDFDAQRLQAAAREIHGEAADVSSLAWVLDVRDSQAVDACLADIARTHGPVTHAVACAGVTAAGGVLSVTDVQWHSVLEVNLHGVMYFCRAAARQLAERGSGAIVTLSSLAGLSAKADRIAYAASKAGVVNLTRALALDLGPWGVRANSVAPGLIDTPMQDNNRASFEAVSQSIPLQRVGRADEIASVVMFLLSEASSYVTGTTLVVDGGITAKYR